MPFKKHISLVCNSTNKIDNYKYRIPLSALSSEAVIGCSIKSVVLRNLFYNVVSSNAGLKNNVFYFSLDGALQTIVIPEGFYSIVNLLPLVVDGINAILATRIPPIQTLSMIYSPLTGKITTTVTDNGNGDIFEMLGGTYPDSINLLIGNAKDFTLDAVTPTPYVMEIIDLGGVDACNLIINEIAKGHGISNGPDPSGETIGLMTMIDFTGSPFGSLVRYQSSNIDADVILYAKPQNLSNLTISLQSLPGPNLDLALSDMHIELVIYLQD